MSKRQIIAGVLSCLFGLQTFAAGIQTARCHEYRQKGLVKGTTNADGAKAVRKWAGRCYPEYQEKISKNPHIIDAKGNKLILYPEFLKLDKAVDPNAEFGFRWVYSDPLDYEINFEAIIADHKTAPCDVPAGYELAVFCAAGCYLPGQIMAFQDSQSMDGVKLSSIGNEMKNFVQGESKMVVLSSEATLEDMSYEDKNIHSYIADLVEVEQDVYVLKTETGKVLGVSPDHPVMNEQGKLQRADDFKVGDKVMNFEGIAEKIVSADKHSYFGRVINLDIASQNDMNHIVIAGGVLNGSYSMQNAIAQSYNRQLLRVSMIPSELLE